MSLEHDIIARAMQKLAGMEEEAASMPPEGMPEEMMGGGEEEEMVTIPKSLLEQLLAAAQAGGGMPAGMPGGEMPSEEMPPSKLGMLIKQALTPTPFSDTINMQDSLMNASHLSNALGSGPDQLMSDAVGASGMPIIPAFGPAISPSGRAENVFSGAQQAGASRISDLQNAMLRMDGPGKSRMEQSLLDLVLPKDVDLNQLDEMSGEIYDEGSAVSSGTPELDIGGLLRGAGGVPTDGY